jgi:hypothetical protein
MREFEYFEVHTSLLHKRDSGLGMSEEIEYERILWGTEDKIKRFLAQVE